MNKERDKSSSTLLHIFIFIIITATTIYHAFADDKDIMAKLAMSLSPTPSGWSGGDPCKWTGVNCDSSGRISSISLVSKSLSGQLPSELNQLSNLKVLNVQRNMLSGTLPSLSNLSSLEQVGLDFNSFSSVPPGFLSGLTSLQNFSINSNTNLSSWIIPESLKDSASLVSFHASKANIVGEIPDIFGSFPNLQNIRLSYNNLTGSLPSSFSNSAIQNLWINNQDSGLSGLIDVIGSMTNLREAWIHVNKFTGPIPDLSGLKQLSDIQFRDNALTGTIPDSLTKLLSLKNVTLQNNKFQGPQPSFPNGVSVSLGDTNNFCNPSPGPCDPQVTTLLEVAGAVGYPMTLAESWQGNNPCKNWIYITCNINGKVTIINFSKQGWTGSISPSIANLTELTSVLLNDNKLTGTIPASLTSLKKLQTLDVSNNNISGKIPDFPPGVTLKTSGNKFIGVELPTNSFGKKSGSNGNILNRIKSSVPPWVIAVSVIATIIVMLLIFCVIYTFYVKKKTGEYPWSKGSMNGSSKKVKNLMAENKNSTPTTNKSSGDYSAYEGGKNTISIEVLREATDNFSEENILGRGGFGVVYKGVLHDGTEIAVKKMESNSTNNKGRQEFEAEIEVLTKVRHRHLVALHGFCINGNERLLVYECMPKGSLGQHLFEWHELGMPPLTWNQRVIIALDVARGVEYLHGLAQQSFIHRDLKPSNILLGNDFRAKVSDFGLVKCTTDGKCSVETRLAGTFGYLAPEYAATGRVTIKVDVYAFGVVLMEMITGRKALDDSLPDDRSQLAIWFKHLLQDKDSLRVEVDTTLQIDEETFQDIWKVAELAGHCTAREPNQRPDMSHAVNILSSLVEQWTPTKEDEDNFGIDLNMTLPQALQKWQANADSSLSMISTGVYDSYNDTASKSTGRKSSDFTSSFSSNDRR